MVELWNLFRREPTIGDHIELSLREEPASWEISRTGPFNWAYTQAEKGWVLRLYSDFRCELLSFDQCGLTGREKRKIMRAIRTINRSNREANRRRALMRAA